MEAEHRTQKQWLLKITAYADRLADELDLVDYPDYVKKSQRDWIGRKEWIDITYPIESTKETVVVSTTRPDTNFGATFIVLAPEHPLIGKILAKELPIEQSILEQVRKYVEETKRKSELERITEGRAKTGVFTGLYAVNQLNNRRMPVWITDFVLMSVGTGAVVGVPGHDLRDFEFAKKFDLPVVRVVVGKDGDKSPIVRKEQVQEEEGVMINSEFLDGLDIHAATKKIMDYLEKKEWGKRTIRYHLRDWVFSRQHYWGEPIPMIFCERCAKNQVQIAQGLALGTQGEALYKGSQGHALYNDEMFGWFPVSEAELPVRLPEVEKYQPTDTGESPLAKITDWVSVACPECGSAARRETDTMPNWAGSSWYYLAFTFADRLAADSKKENIFLENKDRLDYWLGPDIYLGGAEHTTLHLLYSRFWHKFLNDIGMVPGKEPYASRRQHGVILGPDGYRMSKTRGNIVNPEDVINKYGSDTLRCYLMFMGPYDQGGPWDQKGIEGIWRFLNRAWKWSIRAIAENEKAGGKNISAENIKACGKIINKLVKKVGEDIDSLKLNTALSAMMKTLNELEDLSGGVGSLETVRLFLLVLSPFAPHMAEELWLRIAQSSKLKAQNTSDGVRTHSSDLPAGKAGVEGIGYVSIHLHSWPLYDPSMITSDMVNITIQVDGKTRGQLNVKCQMSPASRPRLDSVEDGSPRRSRGRAKDNPCLPAGRSLSNAKCQNEIERMAKKEPKVARH
ncbi:MAG: class I tRNA ligase family protein, partial [bacterium]|nr:class I tRNA ligase family protein [bacterium]